MTSAPRVIDPFLCAELAGQASAAAARAVIRVVGVMADHLGRRWSSRSKDVKSGSVSWPLRMQPGSSSQPNAGSASAGHRLDVVADHEKSVRSESCPLSSPSKFTALQDQSLGAPELMCLSREPLH